MIFSEKDIRNSLHIPLYLSQALNWAEHIPFALMLTSIHRPKTIVELGVYGGDSFFAWALGQRKAVIPDCHIHGVDHWQGDEHMGKYDRTGIYEDVRELAEELLEKERYTLHRKSFEEALPSFSDNSINLLHIDGSHDYEDVSRDFNTYLPKLAPNGIVLFHDTEEVFGAVTGPLEPIVGVKKFFNELKEQHPDKWFQFHHGLGLGVLSPKGCDNPQLNDFFRSVLTSEGENIRLLFNVLGHRVLTTYIWRKNFHADGEEIGPLQ